MYIVSRYGFALTENLPALALPRIDLFSIASLIPIHTGFYLLRVICGPTRTGFRVAFPFRHSCASLSAFRVHSRNGQHLATCHAQAACGFDLRLPPI
jgi:hypothetical protein